MSSEHKFTYTSAVPLDVSWKMLKKGDQIVPKLLPEFFAKIETLEGDGGAGTIRVVTLGEGVGPQVAGKKVKERVEILDEATHTLVYSTIEGGDPRYTDIRQTIKFTAAGDDSTSTEWTINYTPASSDIPPPKELEAWAQTTAKALEGYAKEHPSEFA